MKNTYFESMLSIAFVDKAMVCFIIAIFSKVYDVKTRFDVKQKMRPNKYNFRSQCHPITVFTLSLSNRLFLHHSLQ